MNTEVVVPIGGVSVRVAVLSRASDVEAHVKAMVSSSSSSNTKLVVGLDVEWNSSDPNEKVAILQLSNATKCIIVQLIHLDYIPRVMQDFLVDSNVTFVGVGIERDVAKLKRDYNLGCTNAVELGPLAARVLNKSELKEFGLIKLAIPVFGSFYEKLEKPESVARSDWTARILTSEQIKYAATDAHLGYLIGNKLLV